MGQVSIPLALDLGEREGISFSLKSLCQGTELISGYSGATSWHSRKGKHSSMLSRHVPLVLCTSDEGYGKVWHHKGSRRKTGSGRGTWDSCHRRAAWGHSGVPQPSCHGFTLPPWVSSWLLLGELRLPHTTKDKPRLAGVRRKSCLSI